MAWLGLEASHALLEAYVDVRKISCSRGMVYPYSRQLESLIGLVESKQLMSRDNASIKRLFSSLHLTGGVQMPILTTGMSATSSKQKEEFAEALTKLILSEGKTLALKYQQFLENIWGQFNIVITNMFGEALCASAAADFLTVTEKLFTSVRLFLSLGSCG
uniref:Uncharacterized protein n=1 Tax=Equus caballus TaxID=9796 RepID=A0A3Q2GW99_HORSE